LWQRVPGLTRVLDDSRPPGLPDTAAAPDSVVEMPLPASAQTYFLGGLFALAILAACYVAGEILLPIVLAFVLKLLLQPAMRLLERAYVPRVVAALITIGALFCLLAGLGTALSGPAAEWAGKLPQSVTRLEQRLSLVKRPMDVLLVLTRQADSLMGAPAVAGTPSVEVKGPGLAASLFTGTRNLAAGVLTTSLLLYFLLVSGDTFLRRVVEILPRFRDKRQAVEISQHVESDISAYLITITGMNAAVGVLTAGAMSLCGLGDPILWGAAAFLFRQRGNSVAQWAC
jgi:predicted PurR-regulated permease PerM